MMGQEVNSPIQIMGDTKFVEYPHKIRAVLYARVSKDDRSNDGRNLASQLDMGRVYAEEKGYLIVAEFAEDDRGASGYEINLPQLNKVKDIAEQGDFEVLVVRELDRLSRNLAKQLIIEEELNRAGVRIEYVLAEYEDTPEGRLNKHIRATIAEYEREKIKERLTRGRRNKVKSGLLMLHGDNPCYGYRVAEDGKNLVIYEPEAQIVRQIFVWYTIGDETGKKLGTKAIAGRLTKMGVPTWKDIHNRGYKKRGYAQWSDGTISNILNNETYIGNWYYGRKRKPGEINPRDQWLTIKVPAIISQELWDMAIEQKERNKALARRNVRHDYLISGRVKCGKCGSTIYARSSHAYKNRKIMEKKVYKYYQCAANNGAIVGKTCDLLSFRVDPVDDVIWAHVVEILTDEQRLTEAIEMYQNELEQANAPLRERLQVVEDLLSENQEQLTRLLDLYLAGDFPKEMLTERKDRLEKTIQSLTRERSNLAKHLNNTQLSAEQVEMFREGFKKRVKKGLNLATADFETRRQIIDTLDLQVTLTIENGQRVAYVHHILVPDIVTFSFDEQTYQAVQHQQAGDLSVTNNSSGITWLALASIQSYDGPGSNWSRPGKAIHFG